MKSKPIVDLFAGSGGLSAGLEVEGFHPVFASELHPDALQTYVRNRPNSDVAKSKNTIHDILKLKNESDLLDLSSRLLSEHGEIAAVVGGPPCQGYSGIGHRRSFELDKVEIPSNHLYRNMAAFVSAIGPRTFVFENVRGLLNSKWTPSGTSGEIWNDVRQTFEDIRTRSGLSYNLSWNLFYAKDFGVPQNRPRIVLMGVRSDVGSYTNEEFVSEMMRHSSAPPSIADVLSDLVDQDWQPGGSTEKYPRDAMSLFQEGMRTTQKGIVLKSGDPVSEHTYSKHSELVTKKFAYMLEHNGEIPEEMKTKKFAQRLLPEEWGPKGPHITATSLPDDYVHYVQPRTLTVREWARLQTFPDWYQFVGPRTTGGRRRAGDPSIGNWVRDLPKYTQIGNAVPVNLAKAIGKTLNSVIG